MPTRKRDSGVTLIELSIAVVLISIIVLGITNIDTFYHFHVLNAERRIKIQFENSIALEHMAYKIGTAIGDERVGANKSPVTLLLPSGPLYRGISVWVDENQNGKQDAYPEDRKIGYLYQQGLSAIQYYNPCLGPSCNEAGSLLNETISGQITECTFSWSAGSGNFVDVSIASRSNASAATSLDNPEMNMASRMQMPAVSTH